MENCEKDLMKRLSNTLLKQIKDYKNNNSMMVLNDTEIKKGVPIKKERDNARSFSYKNRNNQALYQLNRLNYQVNKLKREMERSVNKALIEYEKLINKQNMEREADYDGR